MKKTAKSVTKKHRGRVTKAPIKKLAPAPHNIVDNVTRSAMRQMQSAANKAGYDTKLASYPTCVQLTIIIAKKKRPHFQDEYVEN